jgi:ParB/RepB/Spo0J family partition protein
MTTTPVSAVNHMELTGPVTIMVPLNLIDDPAWNSRIVKTGTAAKKEEEKITELARSLESEGQLTPVELEAKDNGRFELVFGSRRRRAANILKWAEIKATVRPASNASERIVRNIVENEQRENLTTYEQARAYSQLRDLGLKNQDIAAKLGKSQSHVSNLSSAFKNLPDPIKVEWQAGHPVATFDNLRTLANKEEFKTPEAQVRKWDDMVNESAEREASGEKAGKRGKGKKNKEKSSASFSLVQANLKAALDLLGSRKNADVKIGGTYKWGHEFASWLIGARKSPPDDLKAAFLAIAEKAS